MSDLEEDITKKKVNCDACPILCRISPGKTGSCDRYGNFEGNLKRIDPIILTQKIVEKNGFINLKKMYV